MAAGFLWGSPGAGQLKGAAEGVSAMESDWLVCYPGGTCYRQVSESKSRGSLAAYAIC